MIKEPLENPYPYFVGALVATATWVLTKIIWPIVDSSVKEKKQNWDNKIDHKDLQIQENAMKTWVTGFLKEALVEFKVTLAEFREELKKLEDKIEKRNEKRFQDYEKLFNEYRASNHGRREQLEATVLMCKDTLTQVEAVLKLTDKLKQQHS